MKKTFWILALGALLALCTGAGAQQLKVATGSAKGTYASVFKEMQQFCGTELAMVEQPSTGAIDNTNLLLGNQVNAAFTQTDILFMRSRTEDLGTIKTLVALYPEQLHFVAKNAPRKSGGYGVGGFSVGGTEYHLTDVAQLAGLRLGAAGGSVETAKLVRLQSEIAFNVVPFGSNDEVAKALAGGQIDAALYVGGQPLGAVKDLGPDYRLLAVGDATAEKLKGVYQTHAKGSNRRVVLNYSKMGAAGVPTVSTDSLLVTREYRSANMLSAMSKFRACVLGRLDDIKDATGTHPAWQQVDAANRGKWPYYEFAPTQAKK